MGMIGGTQLATQTANIDLIKAQTENVKADTERKLGVDKENVEAQTKNLLATTDNEKVRNKLLLIQEDIEEVRRDIAQNTQQDVERQIYKNLELSEQYLRREVRNNHISEATYDEQIGIIKGEYIQVKLHLKRLEDFCYFLSY